MKKFTDLWLGKIFFKNRYLVTCCIILSLILMLVFLSLSFSNSMMNGISEKFVCLSDGHIKVQSPVAIKTSDERIDSLSEVRNIYGLLYSDKDEKAVTIKGTDFSYFNERRNEQIKFIEQSDVVSSNYIAISSSTADSLGLKPGDNVEFLNAQDPTKPLEFRVCLIYSSSYEALDSIMAYASLDFLNEAYGETYKTYEILVKDKFSSSLEDISSSFKGCKINYWYDLHPEIYENFEASRQLIIIILLVVLAAAVFYVASFVMQFINRQKKNNALFSLLGMKSRSSFQVCLYGISFCLILCFILGLLLSSVIGNLLLKTLKILSENNLGIFKYYLLDFKLTVPYKECIILFLLFFVFSFAVEFIILLKLKHTNAMQLFNED